MNEIANKAAYYARIAQYASDGFSQVYLGAKDVAPTTDNNGLPLQEGALYFNTVSNILFVWDGLNWLQIYDEIYLGGFSVAPTLNNRGLPLQAGDLYWNTISNNLWAYNGTTWIRVNFNETTPFLSTGSTTARTLADRCTDIINVKDYGVLSNGTDETAKVQNAANNQSAGELLFIPSNTRHSVKLSDDYQLGVDNRYTANINISSFSNCYNANVSGKNYDKHIYLFGDSHGWGQGAPEWDTFTGVTNWSRYSSGMFNTGFQSRIEEYINWKNNVDDKVYTLNSSTTGLRYTKNNYLPNSEKNTDCLYNNLEVITGTALSGTFTYTPTVSSHPSWFTPATNGDAALIDRWREKLFKSRFNSGLFRIIKEGLTNFHDEGKEEYLTVMPESTVAASVGFSQILDSNGNIIAEYNGTTSFYIRVNVNVPLAQLGFPTSSTDTWFIPGYGKVVTGSPIILSSKVYSIRIYDADGISFPTGLGKYVYANMRIYKNTYISNSLIRANPEKPFRKMYICTRNHTGGRKIAIGIKSFPIDSVNTKPYTRWSSGFSLIPQWNWDRASYPTIKVVAPDGSRATVASGTVEPTYFEIDTYYSGTADVVYEIDFGARISSQVFIQDFGDSDDGASTNTESQIRGIIFGNNDVTNFSMGGRSIGQWIGISNPDGIDPIGEIIDYTKDTPYLVVTQLPLVNEYLQQTPILTFKTNIATFISRLNGVYNTAGTKITDFLFFTTLGTKGIEFEGAASSPITYDMYVAAAKEQIIASNAGFVDCRQMMKDMVSDGIIDYNKLFNDSIHPGPFANELMAQKVCSILDEVL